MMQTIFSLWFKALRLRINSCYSILFSHLKRKKEHIIISRVISSDKGPMYIETPYIYILFTNHSTRAGYDTRSIFKRSLTGLNSEFSFS